MQGGVVGAPIMRSRVQEDWADFQRIVRLGTHGQQQDPWCLVLAPDTEHFLYDIVCCTIQWIDASLS